MQPNNSSQNRQMKCIVILGQDITGGGGSERRYARAFIHFCELGMDDVLLVLTTQVYEALVKLGIQLEKWKEKIITIRSKYFPSGRPELDRLNYPYYVIQLMRAIKQKDIKLLHLTLPSGAFCGGIASLVMNRKCILTIMNAAPSKKARIQLRIFARVSLLIDSIYDVDWLKKYFNKRVLDMLRVAPCSFTSYEKFRPLEKQNLVTFAGRLEQVKNPLLFIHSIPDIIKIFPDTRFIIYGTGTLEDAVRKRIVDLKLENFVSMLSGDIWPVIGTSKIFLSLQKDTNYPSQSLLEAMACCNAIVATDVGNTRKIIDDSVGILVQSSPEAVSKAVISLLSDNIKCEELGNNAMNRVRTSHTVEEFCKYVNSIWKEALQCVK